MTSSTRNSSSLPGEATIPRLIIAGSRSITRYALLLDALRTAVGDAAASRVLEVVSGGARGVDALALPRAHEHRIPARVFATAKCLGIKVNDHVVVSRSGNVSLRAQCPELFARPAEDQE
jgi:hypothetical protein